ncbi:hypothetical protein [Fibrella aquatilis]|uniref:Uncharacterized protein n=1 Tax=Fibrella aquatilis TaxID=2817059 RepID=A0A939G848_9BACT|nr:hypothetical protein [Fibrella aquatilis]MBO0931907.1 hypothetical protein [Fibrella aquatilis]
MNEEKSVSKNEREKRLDRRSKGVFVRLKEAEQLKLKELSRESGISVSQLLRSGALDGLHRLPRFRKLPPTVTTTLSTLDRLTTAMVYLSGRAEQDAIYAQDIRQLVYEVGDVIRQIRQFCANNMASYGSVAQLEILIEQLKNSTDANAIEVKSQLRTLRESFQNDLIQ